MQTTVLPEAAPCSASHFTRWSKPSGSLVKPVGPRVTSCGPVVRVAWKLFEATSMPTKSSTFNLSGVMGNLLGLDVERAESVLS